MNALALRPSSAVAPSLRGAGTAMQTPAGSVSAFFSLEGFDRRNGVAIYALRVVNRTGSALICRTWVVSRAGDVVLAHPLLVEVAPLTTSTTQLPVWAKDFPSYDRAIAEIAGDGVHCIVEAPAPQVRRSGRALAFTAVASVLFGVLALGAAAILRGALPRITAFAIPPETIAGTTIRAEYDAAGAGRLSYSVFAPDGRRIQGGQLSDSSGSIAVTIPPANQPGAYTIEMAMAGPLGTVNSTRVVNTLVTRVRDTAQINAISVTPAVAKPGEAVSVAYSAVGDGGYVRLMGNDGTIWAQRPFSRSGQTNFVIPQVASLRDMRVLVRVTDGSTAAQSMAGLAVAGDDRLPPSAIQVASDDNPGAPAATSSDANGTFEVLERTVKGGTSIHVRIISPRNGMHIALMDGQSHELAGVDVGADASVITLTAPAVTAPANYTVVASFTDGFGQESIVQPVTVTP